MSRATKIATSGDTFNIICWCYECDWSLFPSALLYPDNFQEEKDQLISVYQDEHDAYDECSAIINHKFIQELDTTY